MKALSVKEASAIAGIKPITLYRAIWAGQIPARRIGPKKIIILADELNAYLKNLPPATKKQG